MKPLPISNMQELFAFGEQLVRSGIFGEINPAVGLVIAAHIYQTGITPIDFAANYDVVGGKIARKAKSLLAELVAKGGSYAIHDYTDERVSVTFAFGKVTHTVTTTFGDADRSGLTRDFKGNVKTMWKRFPRRMLFARVVSEGIGVVAPGVNAGLYAPEEVIDFDARDTMIDDGEGTPPAATPQPAELPPDVCPFGDKRGRKWETLDDAALSYALFLPQLAKESRDIIKSILAARDVQAKREPEPDRQPAPQEAKP